MTTGALVISWGASIPGREAKGLEVLGGSLELAQQWVSDGRATAHKEYFSSNRDGGMQIIEGEAEDLQALMQDDEFVAQVVRAQAVVSDLRLELYIGGSDETMQESMGTYMTVMGELGYL